MEFNSKLVEKKEIAKGTMAFSFEKPEGFTFIAGQYIKIEILNPPETDDEGNKRTFSICCTPQDPHIMFATRMRDTAFKRVLKNAEIGAIEAFIRGPFGVLTLNDHPEVPTVMLAGGIGITPFHSMIMDATQTKKPHKIFLFYANHSPEDSAFLSDLQQAALDNPNFIFIPTMTKMEESTQSWQGETKHIDMDMIKQYLPTFATARYMTAGPATMVDGMKKMLADGGIQNENIMYENFAGY